MGNELLEKTSNEVFYSIERWQAFLELYNRKSEIENFWYKKFAEYAVQNSNLDKQWLCNYNESKHLYWYLNINRNLNQESLSIWLERQSKTGDLDLILWASAKNYDINKLNEILFRHEKFQPFRDIFSIDKNNSETSDNEYIFRKKMNFYDSNSILSNDIIFWYMGMNPEVIYNTLLNEIEQFTNEQNTKLFEELHNLCKI